MNEHIEKSSLTDIKPQQNPQVYKSGKMTFIVTPVYREDAVKPIHDILFDLMVKDSASH